MVSRHPVPSNRRRTAPRLPSFAVGFRGFGQKNRACAQSLRRIGAAHSGSAPSIASRSSLSGRRAPCWRPKRQEQGTNEGRAHPTTPTDACARAGAIPRGRGWAFEPKLDGFRALVSTCGGFHVKSRRGWEMTRLLPEFESLPAGLVLDCEFVALGADGKPHFPTLCARMLQRKTNIPRSALRV